MKTAVVILNWNTKDYLREFLPPLLGSLEGMDAELIVADNASTDGSVQMLEEEFPMVRSIVLKENFGFTGGYNRALKEVDAEYYVLINSDILVTEGWLEPLVEWMDTHPQNAACAPKLRSFYDRDRFEYAGAAGGMLDAYGYPFCRGRVMKLTERDEGQYDSPADVFWATGACLLVRSSMWKELKGLDERFFAHMEEIDFCWRAQLKGWKISVVPSSVVFHLGGGTLPATSPRKLKLNFRNDLLMLENNLSKSYVAAGSAPEGAYRQARALIFKRKALDLMSAAVYLGQGKFKFFRAVLEAHKEYRKMRKVASVDDLNMYLSTLNGERRTIDGWYPRWIVWDAFIKDVKIFDYLRRYEDSH